MRVFLSGDFCGCLKVQPVKLVIHLGGSLSIESTRNSWLISLSSVLTKGLFRDVYGILGVIGSTTHIYYIWRLH